MEDSLSRQIQFRNWLGSSAKIISKVCAAIDALRRERFDLVFLDRDLGFGEFGEDVARAMVELKFPRQCIVHSDNPFGVELISTILQEGQIQVECVPFALLGLIRDR